MKSIVLSLVFLLSSNLAFATPEVLSVRGKVFWNRVPVKAEMKLEGKGRLKSEEASAVILKWDSLGSEVRLAAESELGWDEQSQTPELLNGRVLCHIRNPVNTKAVEKPTKDAKIFTRFTLKTPAAVMGVRGTKFIGVSNPLLNEAEIVVFDGVVEFKSAKDSNDLRMITENHWGGIGGRFGFKTTNPIVLPAKVLQAFLNSKDFQTDQSELIY